MPETTEPPMPPDAERPDDPIEPIKRLTRDLRAAAKTLTTTEARYLVDAYYQMQRDRIRATHQVRTLAEAGEPSSVIGWLEDNTGILERNIKSALGAYSQSQVVGKWAESIVGIGPVISAGLLAHITLEPWRCGNPKRPKTVKCGPGAPCMPLCGVRPTETVGKIWRFAGLDPTVQWKEGQKRPWNGALKRLCWIIGESFVKVQSRDQDVYGQLYAQRKAIEEQKNAAGDFKAQADISLTTKRWTRETSTRTAYEAGHLPQARIHLRAERWAVKLFLAHWFTVAYFHRWGKMPPKPYVIQHLGHTDLIPVPNWPFDHA